MDGGDPAPGKSFTATEYAAQFKMPLQTAAGQILRLVHQGALLSGTKQIKDTRGHRIAARCYWVPEA
jgi:hypothetical protein